MNDNERYEQLCEPAFDRLEAKTDKVLSILQGNGSEGLCSTVKVQGEQIRALQSCKNWVLGIVGGIVSSLIIAGIIALVVHYR